MKRQCGRSADPMDLLNDHTKPSATEPLLTSESLV